MKIGIVCYPTLGGSGVIATELGHALAEEGHEIHFITYEIPFRLNIENKNIHFHEVEINRYDLFKYPDYALPLAVKIASVSKEYDLDILHVHYAIPHATSAYLAKQILGTDKPKVITTLHGTDITIVGRDAAYYEIVKYSIEHSDGVTAVSKNLQEQTQKDFQIDKPIEMIYNFFSPRDELVGEKPMRSCYVKEGERLLVHASNFREVKRVRDVVKIFMEVRQSLKCKLLMVGTGPEIEGVFQMVHDHHLEEEVYFVGKNRDIDPYIASADLLLLPSEQESFGVVALEAMAYGVPVVATNIGGLPEVVVDGKTGFLSSVGDIDEMAKNALKILTDEELYEGMSRAGMQRARENFCLSNILPHYLAYYTQTTS